MSMLILSCISHQCCAAHAAVDVDMAFSGMLDSMPQDKCVTLQSFNHCFAKMSGGGDCMDSSRGHIYGQLQCITLTLESETAALVGPPQGICDSSYDCVPPRSIFMRSLNCIMFHQDVTAATARLLSRILLESPSFAHCMPGIALLRPLHALFPYGSDEHQVRDGVLLMEGGAQGASK